MICFIGQYPMLIIFILPDGGGLSAPEKQLRLAGQAERIGRAIDLAGGTIRASQLLDLNRGTLLKWRKGEARIPLDEAALLAREAGVTLDWVATGADAKAVDAPTQISRFSVDAAGAPVMQPPDADALSVMREFFPLHRLDPQKTGIVRVIGDAMRDQLPEGSLAIIDMRVTIFNGDGIFALGRPGAVLFRNVRFEGDSVRLSADDAKHHADVVLKGSDAFDFKIWGRVAMALTRK